MPRRKPESEEWTTEQVADFLHLGTGSTPEVRRASTRRQLSRWGIEATGRKPGRTGENLYPAAAVRAAHANRPRAGRRNDTEEST